VSAGFSTEKAAARLCILHRKSAGRENGANKKENLRFFEKTLAKCTKM
jgi:hypothetical protein